MTTTKTIAGRVPFIEVSRFSVGLGGKFWISDNRGSVLNKIKVAWDEKNCGLPGINYYYWLTREAAQAYIDKHADKPDAKCDYYGRIINGPVPSCSMCSNDQSQQVGNLQVVAESTTRRDSRGAGIAERTWHVG